MDIISNILSFSPVHGARHAGLGGARATFSPILPPSSTQ
jgi:hypothetical protein